ncbi:MAG: hypothetical protein QF552_09105 [Litorilituus sp.]|nr:hypothetical protein [Litorilituus sp.]
MKIPSAFIIGAAKKQDNEGSLEQVLLLEFQLLQLGVVPKYLVIEPLKADWHSPEKENHFRSGCAPIEALAKAKELIENGASAVVISGEDHIKTGYSREERLSKMAVYGQSYPLTQAYTDLARAFSEHHAITKQQFKKCSSALFENYKISFCNALSDRYSPDFLPDLRWHKPITDLFRGIDCANPMVDFSGRLLITREDIAEQLGVDKSQWLKVKAVGLSRLEGDGHEFLTDIAQYEHLHKAYQQACNEANIDFVHQFKAGNALLETYTCYPVVPMAFLLVSGLVDALEDIPEFLAEHSITITGGMNLGKAAWNNPALNALVLMYHRLCGGQEKLGMIHGNGGLGYRQGVAIVACADV